MELKHIKELMAAMGRTGTKRLIYKKEGVELHLERADSGTFRGNDASLDLGEETPSRENALHRANIALSLGGKDIPNSLSNPPAAVEAVKEDITSTYVTSPMVGTFYSAPTPEDPAFVKIGDRIEKNSVVCIIEAMKVMNEVKAGVTGIVAEVLVENGHPVEFGTKLFRIS